MSYINDALKKAQKENKSSYAAYENIINNDAAPEKEQNPAKRRLAAYLLTTAALLAVLIFLITDQLADKKTAPDPSAKTSAPEAKPVIAEQLPAVAQVTSSEARSLPLSGVEKLRNDPAPPPAKTEHVALSAQHPEIVDPDVLFARALKKQNEGKLVEARELYKKVIKLDPYNVQALNNLGVIYLNRKNYQRAINRFNDALKVNPDYVYVHYNLACAYSQKKDLDRSLSYLKKAAQLNSEVLRWAENDADLRELVNLSEFRKLLEGQEN